MVQRDCIQTHDPTGVDAGCVVITSASHIKLTVSCIFMNNTNKIRRFQEGHFRISSKGREATNQTEERHEATELTN